MKKVGETDNIPESFKKSFTDRNGRVTFPYIILCDNPDAVAMSMTIDGLQRASVITSNMYFDYSNVVKGIVGF